MSFWDPWIFYPVCSVLVAAVLYGAYVFYTILELERDAQQYFDEQEKRSDK